MDAKTLADALTGSRLLIALVLPFASSLPALDGLRAAALLLLLSWLTDALDGPLARRSGRAGSTWLGNHDVWVDATVSMGLLAYLALAGYVAIAAALGYVLLWAMVYLALGFSHSLLMLVQAPIYGGFLWLLGHEAPALCAVLVVWLLALLVVYRRRFLHEVVPGFLSGLWQRQ